VNWEVAVAKRAENRIKLGLRNWARIGAFFVAVMAAFSLAAASSDASPGPAHAPALGAKLGVERGLILKGATRTVYVLVRFAAPELDVAPRLRPPLNLTLVLDRSGSMSEKGKIENVRAAAKMAVSRLGERDVISVVEFDDQITTMWPASHVHDQTRLQTMIDALTPRGSTDLAGGLERGIAIDKGAEDELHLSRETLSRVVLLSDGLANVGVTDHGAIARMAGAARDGGVRVSTIGLGVDYDEDLMQAIAESGGGKYYYVESPVQLARIFEEELQSAFAARARDVHLAFHGSSAVHSAELIGFSSSNGRDVSADWPDFYAGETRSVLLRLEVDAANDGRLDLGHFDVAWHDAASGASGTLDMPISVGVTEDTAASDRSLDKDVSVEASLAESERNLTGSVKLYEAGKVDEARKENDAVITALKTKNETLKDERIARKIEALSVEQNQMSAAAAPAAPPDAKAAYLKASKARLYQSKSGGRSSDELKLGDKGLAVEQLQTALSKAGVYKGKVNGVYDQPTADAVKAYQHSRALPADGVAGATTQDALGLY